MDLIPTVLGRLCLLVMGLPADFQLLILAPFPTPTLPRSPLLSLAARLQEGERYREGRTPSF